MNAEEGPDGGWTEQKKEKREKKYHWFFHPAAQTTGPTQQAAAAVPGMAFLHVNKLCTHYQHSLPPFDHPGECAKCLWPFSESDITLLHIITTPYYLLKKKRLDFHYDQNRVVTERISTYWKDFTHAWFDALWSVRRSYRLSFPLYLDLGAFNLASLKINKNKTDSGPFPVENHSLAKTLISHYPVMLISDPGNTSVCLAIIGSVVIVIMIIMPSS